MCAGKEGREVVRGEEGEGADGRRAVDSLSWPTLRGARQSVNTVISVEKRETRAEEGDGARRTHMHGYEVGAGHWFWMVWRHEPQTPEQVILMSMSSSDHFFGVSGRGGARRRGSGVSQGGLLKKARAQLEGSHGRRTGPGLGLEGLAVSLCWCGAVQRGARVSGQSGGLIAEEAHLGEGGLARELLGNGRHGAGCVLGRSRVR